MRHDSPIRNVVIVGGGTAGWMTAAALSKALNNSSHHIQLVESPQVDTVGVGESTIPSMVAFNNFIGLNERDFMRSTQATFKLGIEFVNWRQLGDRYIHPFGEYGIELSSLPFHHYWLRMQSTGQTPPLHHFSLETQAIEAGRFIKNTGIEHPKLQRMAFAYQLDATLYAQALKQLAMDRGVEHVVGHVEHTEIDSGDGTIKGVALSSGDYLQGDLFVDCSGGNALLIEKALGVGYEDWSHWLPCDSAWVVQSEGNSAMAPYTRASAHKAGWSWRIPLQHRTGNGCVFSSRYMEDEEAKDVLLEGLETQALAEPRILRFRTGMRKKLWYRNCVAVGLSAGFVEPLESTSIHLIQLGIFRLLGLFPQRRLEPELMDAYNTEIHSTASYIRDFIILHYAANERTDSTFWHDCRNRDLPDSLRRRLELYKNAAVILPREYDLFKESSWLAVLEGQGVRPSRHHPLAEEFSNDYLKRAFSQVRKMFKQAVTDMPSSEAFIKHYCG